MLTERVPEDEGEIIVLFSLLAEFQERTLAGLGIKEVDHEAIDLALVVNSGCEAGGAPRKKYALVGRGVGQGREVGGRLGVGLDAALVRVVLQVVHV